MELQSPDEKDQDAVKHVANELLRVIAGMPIPVAHTAIVLMVASSICTITKTLAERKDAAEFFYKQVLKMIEDEQIVGWITAHIKNMAPSTNKVQ